MPVPPQPPSRSIWLEEDDGGRGAATPKLPGRADVVVVGAGVVGLATAAMLAEAGADVLVVDFRDPASGVTGHSTAKVTVLHELTAARIARRRGDDAAAAYIAANRFGADWIEERVAGDGIKCAWQERDAVTYLTGTSSKNELVARDAELYRANGVDVELTDELDLPYDVTAAIRAPGQHQFDPVAFARGLADAFVTNGGAIVTGIRATGVGGGRSGVTVETDHGKVAAGHVVVATGLPFLDRGLLFARAEPSSSYVIACKVEAEHPSGMYLSADGAKRSLRTAETDDGEVLLVGGESHKTGQGGDTEQRYGELARWTDQHFGVKAITARYMAEDFMTPDHVPFAGPISPGSDRILVTTGLNKWGFTNGVACAAVNSARILGRPAPAWAETFSTGRLPLRGVDRFAKANANVAVHLVGGWLGALTSSASAPAPGEGDSGRSGARIVAVSADERGKPCRVSGVCTHLGGIVAWNPAEATWDCPLHGSRFEREGGLLHGPAVADLEQLDNS